jgi:hypothetical protein
MATLDESNSATVHASVVETFNATFRESKLSTRNAAVIAAISTATFGPNLPAFSTAIFPTIAAYMSAIFSTNPTYQPAFG